MEKNIWVLVFSILLVGVSVTSSASEKTTHDPYLTIYIIAMVRSPRMATTCHAGA